MARTSSRRIASIVTASTITASIVAAAVGAVLAVSGCSPEHPSADPRPAGARAVDPLGGEAADQTPAPDDVRQSTYGSTPMPESSPCDVASPGVLAAAASAAPSSSRPASPIVIGSVACSGDYAIGRTAPRPGRQGAGILFRFESGTWRAVGIGSAVDCRAFGVPADVIRDLPGCR